MEDFLKDVLSQYNLKIEHLHEKCPRNVRLEIAKELIDWKMVGYYLKLSEQDLTAVECDNHTEAQRRVAMLETWHKRNGSDATYLRLANALHQHGRKDVVELLCRTVKKANNNIGSADEHHQLVQTCTRTYYK
jgi:hypothetical protein